MTVKNALVFTDGRFVKTNILIDNGTIVALGNDVLPGSTVFDFNNCHIFPGFADVHVHLREPGFSYKETIKSGTMAAAHGGYTAVCSMPNLKPVPDSTASIKQQLDIIERDAVISVYPYASITVGQKGEELSDFEELSKLAVAFSDDGKGVQNEEMMLEAMKKAKKYGKIIAAHCEDNTLLGGGYIRDGEYSEKNNHKGINPESEWKQVQRDLSLAEKTKAAYHVCHVSTKESVELLRQARKKGVDATAETAPHYLVLTENDLKESGSYKMNPPIGNEADREALLFGINDGTIGMIATDHAPHSKEEKSGGLKDSLMGIVGLETAFAVLYTELVKKNKVSLEKIVELMSINPRKRFSLGGGEIKVGEKADFTVFDLSEEYTINADNFLSMGRSTPFEGKTVFGKCKMTVCNGKIAYEERMSEG